MDWDTWLHMLCRDYENAPRWANNEWLDLLHERSGKKRFQYCLNSDGFIHYLRAIQGHSGGNQVDPLLLDSVKIPYMWSEYLYHVGSSLCMHSIIHAGLIAGGKDAEEGRQTVFFKSVNPIIILYDSEPADCVGKVVNTKTKEILFQRVSLLSPRSLKLTSESKAFTSGSPARRRANTKN